MRVLEKTVVIPHRPGRAPVCGVIAYASDEAPILFRRTGWEIGNDVHDDFEDALSYDNGRALTAPVRTLGGRDVTAPTKGFEFFIESAALLCPDRRCLVTFVDRCFTPSKDNYSANQSNQVRVAVLGAADPRRRQAALRELSVETSLFGLPQGVCVSFCVPHRDRRGRVLAPVQWQVRDDDGSIRARGFPDRTDQPGVMQDVWAVGLLIGEFTGPAPDPTLRWRLGGAVPCAFDKSSRGMCEGALAELPDGRLALVLRGSNAAWPDRPGYKWVSFSGDGGETWTEAEPLACDDGTLIESSATGSGFLRDSRTPGGGKLYWIGNLCLDGERPNGNMPRSPLVIAEVQEEPFALKRGTIGVIDQRAPHEDPRVQHSNFKYYQDRETGDLVLYLTRYGERGSDGLDWMHADHYRYRIRL